MCQDGAIGWTLPLNAMSAGGNVPSFHNVRFDFRFCNPRMKGVKSRNITTKTQKYTDICTYGWVVSVCYLSFQDIPSYYWNLLNGAFQKWLTLFLLTYLCVSDLCVHSCVCICFFFLFFAKMVDSFKSSGAFAPGSSKYVLAACLRGGKCACFL